MQVCWRRLKSFRAVGGDLLAAYTEAVRVEVEGRRRLRAVEGGRVARRELVWCEESPGYCGDTQGRRCSLQHSGRREEKIITGK